MPVWFHCQMFQLTLIDFVGCLTGGHLVCACLITHVWGWYFQGGMGVSGPVLLLGPQRSQTLHVKQLNTRTALTTDEAGKEKSMVQKKEDWDGGGEKWEKNFKSERQQHEVNEENKKIWGQKGKRMFFLFFFLFFVGGVHYKKFYTYRYGTFDQSFDIIWQGTCFYFIMHENKSWMQHYQLNLLRIC